MRERTKYRFNSSGFTLTELMVVIAIMVILSAIAVPALSRWMPQYRLKEAVRDLYSTMQLVKMTAVKGNQNENIVFSTAPHQYAYTLSGVSKIVVLSDYGSGVKFDDPSHALTFTASPVTFDGRGFSSSGVSVFLSNQANTGYFVVNLQASGAVQLQELP